MDHIWDGFYTGQLRMSRFPGLIPLGKKIKVEFSGTPPGNLVFTVITDSSAAKGTTVHIKYPKPGKLEIYNNGVMVQPNQWDESLGAQAVISSVPTHGENRFVGVENILEFYIAPN